MFEVTFDLFDDFQETLRGGSRVEKGFIIFTDLSVHLCFLPKSERREEGLVLNFLLFVVQAACLCSFESLADLRLSGMTRVARAEMNPVVVLPKKSLPVMNLYHFRRDSARGRLSRLSRISRSRYDTCFCILFICYLIPLKESAR